MNGLCYRASPTALRLVVVACHRECAEAHDIKNLNPPAEMGNQTVSALYVPALFHVIFILPLKWVHPLAYLHAASLVVCLMFADSAYFDDCDSVLSGVIVLHTTVCALVSCNIFWAADEVSRLHLAIATFLCILILRRCHGEANTDGDEPAQPSPKESVDMPCLEYGRESSVPTRSVSM